MKVFHGIRAISFDVGGTLIEPWPSVGHAYATVAAEAGLPSFHPDWLNARFNAAWKERGEFDYSREAWAGVVARTFGGGAAEFGAGTDFFRRIYQRFAEAQVWRLYPDVLPTLEILQKQGLKLAVISNWDDRLRPLLRNLDLDVFFESIEVSGESGFHKPALEIYARAARAMAISCEHVLHVGDSVREDYEGAQEAGMQAVLLCRAGPALPEGAIPSLTELPRLLA